MDYLDRLGGLLPDKRKRASFALDAAGLPSDGDRKSMEPMAARAARDPAQVTAMHHRFIHFTKSKSWDDQPVRHFVARHAGAA